MKNLKMSAVITGLVAAVSLVAFIVLFLFISSDIKGNMEKDAMDNMETVLMAREAVVEDFVEQGKNILIAFSNGSELSTLLADEENVQAYEAAMAYNGKFFGRLDGWEAVYLANWDSKVLTHISEGPVGMVLRKDDSLTGLRDSMMANEVFVPGIIVSPASGQLMLSMYSKIEDANGQPIGFVGGGTYANVLKEKLNSVVAAGLPNASGYMINVEKKEHIIDVDETLAGQPIENGMLLSVIEKIEGGSEKGSIEYTSPEGVSSIAMYMYLPEYNWAMVISDAKSEVYAAASKSNTSIAITFIIAFIVLALATTGAVIVAVSPLSKITKSIDMLQQLDLQDDRTIAAYVGKKSEVGRIATAVESLRESLRTIVDTIAQCSDSLLSSANNMDKEAVGLIENVTDNAAVTEELAASITSTNEAISEAERRVGDIRTKVEAIIQKMEMSKELSVEMTSSATSMREKAVELLQDSETSIADNRSSMSETIEGLRSLSQINNLASEILKITSQTNMLSLNASIEAARAGEAGRGFAVVAGEIGNLAGDSSKTANDIQAICAETNTNIEATQECFDTVIAYLEKDVSAAFTEFADNAASYNEDVNAVQTKIVEVSEAAKELEGALQIIVEQMETVTSASKDNACGVDEIVAKNESTTETADNISKAVEISVKNADELRAIVGKFSR